MEVGTHSPWLSRLAGRLGHEVIVANARQVQLISAQQRKDDRMDARLLGAAGARRSRAAAAHPASQRSGRKQDLMAIRVRAALVEARTSLDECGAGGFAKAVGERLPVCDADTLVRAQDGGAGRKPASKHCAVAGAGGHR